MLNESIAGERQRDEVIDSVGDFFQEVQVFTTSGVANQSTSFGFDHDILLSLVFRVNKDEFSAGKVLVEASQEDYERVLNVLVELSVVIKIVEAFGILC